MDLKPKTVLREFDELAKEREEIDHSKREAVII